MDEEVCIYASRDWEECLAITAFFFHGSMILLFLSVLRTPTIPLLIPVDVILTALCLRVAWIWKVTAEALDEAIVAEVLHS